MIRLEQILTPRPFPGETCRAAVKKRVLEQIANLVARELPGFDAQDIFENLVARERLGSTGFGNG
ncbi:PTS fructose transporter subunit IIA, partial [Pseudomonas sp. ATCC 13867]